LNLAVYLRLHLALSLAALHIWIRAHSFSLFCGAQICREPHGNLPTVS
jgi:hypothetical protein